MVQGIGNDGVLSGQQRFEHAAVRIEAGGIEDGILRMEEVGNGFLQLFVQVLRAADEADRRHAVTPLVHGLLGGVDQALRVGEAEVVVRAEVQRDAAVFQSNLRALGRCNVALILVKAGFLDGGELVLQVFLEFSVHGIVCFSIAVGLTNLCFSPEKAIINLAFRQKNVNLCTTFDNTE